MSARTSEDQFPKFVVVSIFYTPAGKQGSVSYGVGSSEGGRFQVTTSQSVGAVLQTSVFGASMSNTYSFGQVAATTVGFSKLDAFTEGFANPGTYDLPDRKNDVFRIWRNPKMTHYSGGGSPDQLTWSVNGSQLSTFDFTARQLLGEEQVPADKLLFYSSLTPAEKVAILALDPAFGSGTYSPARYQKVGAYQLRGPDNAGDMIPFGTYTTSYNTSRDQTYGTSVNNSQTILVGFEFLGAGGKAGITYSVGYQESRTSSVGDQKNASITMRTPTVCFVMDVDLFIDAAFGTYLTVPTSTRSCASTPVVAGQLTTEAGTPAANQAFVSPTSTGARVIYTDSNGYYKGY